MTRNVCLTYLMRSMVSNVTQPTGREAFDKDELIQTWMIHHIEIIGEAASKLSAEFRGRYGDIPWPEIVAMRNIIAHEYFGIDLDTVWQVVERDLPGLKRRLKDISLTLT